MQKATVYLSYCQLFDIRGQDVRMADANNTTVVLGISQTVRYAVNKMELQAAVGMHHAFQRCGNSCARIKQQYT